MRVRANARPRWRAGALSLATLASVGLLVVAPASPASADPACVNGGVYVLFARGSGQGFDDAEAVAFKGTVYSALNAIDPNIPRAWAELGNLNGDYDPQNNLDPGEYPATGVNWTFPFSQEQQTQYYGSVNIGIAELQTHLNNRVNTCPGEAIVLGGYSQGADVVANVVLSLSATVRDRIGYVALYGDPSFNSCGGNAWWGRGSYWGCTVGFLGARNPYTTENLQGRVGSWCDVGDGICTANVACGGTFPCTHTTAYRNAWILASAPEVAQNAVYKRDQLLQGFPVVVIRAGGGIFAKPVLGSNWLNMGGTGNAVDIKAAGDRVAFRDASGYLYASEGIGTHWHTMYGPVDQYAFSESLFVIRTGMAILGKARLIDPWITLNGTPAVDMRAEANRITYTDTNGQLWAKDGLLGPWVNVYGPVDQYVANSLLIVIRLGQNIFGKAGLTDAWVQLNPSPVGNDLRLYNTRISWTDASGNLFAKDGLSGPWVNVYGPVDQYSAATGKFVVRGGTGLHAKIGSLASGWYWSFNPTAAADVRVSQNVISYTDTSGSLWARQDINQPWLNIYGPVSQYVIQ